MLTPLNLVKEYNFLSIVNQAKFLNMEIHKTVQFISKKKAKNTHNGLRSHLYKFKC